MSYVGSTSIEPGNVSTDCVVSLTVINIRFSLLETYDHAASPQASKTRDLMHTANSRSSGSICVLKMSSGLRPRA